MMPSGWLAGSRPSPPTPHFLAMAQISLSRRFVLPAQSGSVSLQVRLTASVLLKYPMQALFSVQWCFPGKTAASGDYKTRRFGRLMTKTESLSETSHFVNLLRRLPVREKFIEFCRLESFKTHCFVLLLKQTFIIFVLLRATFWSDYWYFTISFTQTIIYIKIHSNVCDGFITPN